MASGSPRRRELLEIINPNFEICVSNAKEEVADGAPSQVVMNLSMQKAVEVYKRKIEQEKNILVIGADTVVVLDDCILGKPKTKQEAFEMLSSLQGRNHQVYTGVTLIYDSGDGEERRTFFEKTEVCVASMNENEINAYIATGEPMDKAGAYGIQTEFGKYISYIYGDYNNVVGLPVARLYSELSDI